MNKPLSFILKNETISRPITAAHGYIGNRSCSDRVDSNIQSTLLRQIAPLICYDAVHWNIPGLNG